MRNESSVNNAGRMDYPLTRTSRRLGRRADFERKPVLMDRLFQKTIT